MGYENGNNKCLLSPRANKEETIAQYSMSIIRRFLLKLKKTEKVAKELRKDLLGLYGINHCFSFNRFINVFFLHNNVSTNLKAPKLCS